MNRIRGLEEAIHAFHTFGSRLGLGPLGVVDDLDSKKSPSCPDGSYVCEHLGWQVEIIERFQELSPHYRPFRQCCAQTLPYVSIVPRSERELADVPETFRQYHHDFASCGVGTMIVVPVHRPRGKVGAALLFSRERVDLRPLVERHEYLLLGLSHTVLHYAAPPAAETPAPPLSTRQRECLLWASRGKTMEETAIIMGISPHTARSYLKIAITQLGAVNTTQAVAIALRHRLLELEE